MREGFFKIIIVFVFLLLLANLIKTQIITGSYYRVIAAQNRIREVPIHPARGIIYDRNGQPLVINLPAFRLGKQAISKEQAIILEATSNEIPEIDSVRSYPFKEIFSHVLGYVNADRRGQGGVEEEYDQKLLGKDGAELVEVDATGKKIRVLKTVPAVSGENIILTLDLNLQKEAYKALGIKKGAVVASNPKTGEILALVSSPSFNPEQVADFLNAKDQPLFDRSISGTYPPGSTFKIITAVAGLETKAITGATQFLDTGVLEVGPYKFPNWKWLRNGGTDGLLNVVTAIKNSNDIFFYKTGEAVGLDNLVSWAKKFGLGETLGIDLPGEARGLIKNDRDWYTGDTYHMAIGQADLLVTPLQVNFWTSVIANGGKLCRPHLAGTASCQDLNIKPETVNLVEKGLIAACSDGGTAYPLFGMGMACKTGTAEFGDPSNRTHAWLTGFYSVDNPEIAVTVLVEGGGEGSDVAAPIVKKILEAWFAK